MLSPVIQAVVVGIIVWLVCILVGGLLVAAVPLSWVDTIGNFLVNFGALLGLLATLWYYFSGRRL